MLIYYRKKKGAMEYAFSCGFFDIFLYFQHCFGGKGGAEVVVFKKTNKKRKVQRKMLGVPSNFGSDCLNGNLKLIRYTVTRYIYP